MKVKHLERAGIVKALKRLMDSFDEYYWAVAWGTENPLADVLDKNRDKIRRLVFGSHFYQTDPILLERFIGEKYIRIMPNNSNGTFHPKIYLFVKRDKAAAIVGSANFTNGAMEKNSEVALLLEGDISDEAFVDVRGTIEAAWESGSKLSQEFLNDYRHGYNVTKKYRLKLTAQHRRKQAKKGAKHFGFLTWSWSEYSRSVRDDAHHSFSGRLDLLRESHRMFASVNVFSDMTDDERRAIAGFLGAGKEHTPGAVMEWGWFGSMKGAGDFKNVMLSKSQCIDEALDYIPMTGEVSKGQYDNYIKLFSRSFAGKARKGGVATASRLLAMKRPDTFVCVDSKNRRGLGGDIGFAHSTLNFDKYWCDVIIPITESVWWQSERPGGEEGKLWDGRAAMLDAIYYDE